MKAAIYLLDAISAAIELLREFILNQACYMMLYVIRRKQHSHWENKWKLNLYNTGAVCGGKKQH